MQGIKLRFELNLHTPQERDFHFRSEYTTRHCPRTFPFPETSSSHLPQPQSTKEVARLFSAGFLAEVAGTSCPIVRFAEGKGQFDKAMSGKSHFTSKPEVRL